MNSFIKVIEIWTPTADRQRLKLCDGIFGNHLEFEEISRNIEFEYGEGLPGKAWSTAYPQIITDFENSYFLRTQKARDIHLSAAIAYPIFSGEFLLAVVVFLCGDSSYNAGAIELWGSDSDPQDELKLIDGYYGSLHILEHISRTMTFKKGEGLPGTVWDYNIPVLVDNPADSPIFKRRGTAENDGITMAFGIPYRYQYNEIVLTLLSSLDNPIAKRVEVWVPDRSHSFLCFHTGKCETGEDLASAYENKKITRHDGLVGKAWLSGCPQISRDLQKDSMIINDCANHSDNACIIPIIDHGLLHSVVILYL